MSVTAQQIAAAATLKAASHLGDQEDASHDNAGPQVDRFEAYVGVDHASWCMAFACFCFGKAAESMGTTLGAVNLIKTASCAVQADHARANGHLVSAPAARGSLKPGWLMLVHEGGDYHHTGVVMSFNQAAGTFQTVEGNTNTDGGREGYEVARQTRRIGDMDGDQPKYAFIQTFN